MDSSTMVSYSFKEKYFQIEPEGRIRRYQYFVRCLIPGILCILIMMFVIPTIATIVLSVSGIDQFLVMMYMAMTIMMLSQILYVVIFYKIGLSLITKRCYDFGSDGKIATTIFKIQMAITVLNIISLGFIIGNITIPGRDIFGTVSQIAGVCGFIMGIFLLFRPGNKGDNQYGKDPINTKVEFLG